MVRDELTRKQEETDISKYNKNINIKKYKILVLA